ncbi:MAG: hypothetical protein ABIQ32_05750 [Sphingomicrobium sp.]
MSDGPEWFAQTPGTYSAVPIAWQGWALTVGFVAFVVAAGQYLSNRPAAGVAIFVPLTVLFIVIVVKTTRGGWRWRWGSRD